MAECPIVIIGAGPAGLSAAYELMKHGRPATIVEADNRVGGLSRTECYQGYRFDIGGHRFFSKVPLINDVWQEILGQDFLLRPRLSRIHYRGHFFDYPLKASNAIVGLGLVEAVHVILSYAKTKLFPYKREENFEEWVANRFGYRLYQIFFRTYTEKVWGMPCTEIAADWAAQRIKNLSLWKALQAALIGSWGTHNDQVITTLIDQFHYPRLGPGMMWEACESLLSIGGSQTLQGVRVEQIAHRNDRVTQVVGRTSQGERLSFETHACISTMPLQELILALTPAPPSEVVQAARQLRYRDYLTVVLIVKQADIFPDNWIYIHSPEVRMGRIQNYKNWSPEMVPDPSRTSLGLEYFLWDTDGEWTWSDERLIERGMREAAQIGLIHPHDVEDSTVVRMEKAYPVYDQYYVQHVATIRRYLERFHNLQTVGRNGLHRYNNQDHSMLTGIYAARNIVGEACDVWSVNTEETYHEGGRAVPATAGDRLVP